MRSATPWLTSPPQITRTTPDGREVGVAEDMPTAAREIWQGRLSRKEGYQERKEGRKEGYEGRKEGYGRKEGGKEGRKESHRRKEGGRGGLEGRTKVYQEREDTSRETRQGVPKIPS